MNGLSAKFSFFTYLKSRVKSTFRNDIIPGPHEVSCKHQPRPTLPLGPVEPVDLTTYGDSITRRDVKNFITLHRSLYKIKLNLEERFSLQLKADVVKAPPLLDLPRFKEDLESINFYKKFSKVEMKNWQLIPAKRDLPYVHYMGGVISNYNSKKAIDDLWREFRAGQNFQEIEHTHFKIDFWRELIENCNLFLYGTIHLALFLYSSYTLSKILRSTLSAALRIFKRTYLNFKQKRLRFKDIFESVVCFLVNILLGFLLYFAFSLSGIISNIILVIANALISRGVKDISLLCLFTLRYILYPGDKSNNVASFSNLRITFLMFKRYIPGLSSSGSFVQRSTLSIFDDYVSNYHFYSSYSLINWAETLVSFALLKRSFFSLVRLVKKVVSQRSFEKKDLFYAYAYLICIVTLLLNIGLMAGVIVTPELYNELITIALKFMEGGWKYPGKELVIYK